MLRTCSILHKKTVTEIEKETTLNTPFIVSLVDVVLVWKLIFDPHLLLSVYIIERKKERI